METEKERDSAAAKREVTVRVDSVILSGEEAGAEAAAEALILKLELELEEGQGHNEEKELDQRERGRVLRQGAEAVGREGFGGKRARG